MAANNGFRVIEIVLSAIMLAGCGVGQPGTSASAVATAENPASPAGSAFVSSPVPAGCPNFVEVVETGPMPGDDGTEFGPVAMAQQRISADVDAAAAYGAAHPGEFASVRYENGPRVRMVIGFTANIERHCAALRAMLEYPDEFEIILQPATEDRLAEIQLEIVALAGDRLRSVGIGAGTMDAQLRADGADIAEAIHAKYGDLVSITVGLLPYPDPFAGAPDCAALIDGRTSDAPLAATATLDGAAIHPGEDFRGTVVITNIGNAPYQFQSGPTQIAVVYRPGAATPSGFFTGGLDSIGYGKLLAAGESVSLDLLGGTASCDPALGYALPPGSWEARVRLELLTMHDTAPTDVSYLISGSVSLTIAP